MYTMEIAVPLNALHLSQNVQVCSNCITSLNILTKTADVFHYTDIVPNLVLSTHYKLQASEFIL